MDGCAGQTTKGWLWLLRLVLVLLLLAFYHRMASGGIADDAPPPVPQRANDAPAGGVKDKPSPAAYFFFMMGYDHELNQRFSEASAAYRVALDYDPDSIVLITSLTSVM